MANPEKDLQDLLDALENGQNLESLLQGLPDESLELASLLQLATQIKKTKHPEPSLEQTSRQQQKVMAAVRDTFTQRRSIWKRPSWSWKFAGSLVGAITIVLVFIFIAAAGSFAAVTLDNWTTVEVVEAAGVLQVLSQDKSQLWQTIQSGERMREGERIRTSTDSTALLRFPDGSQIILAPQTEISLVKVKRSWDGQVDIVLIQHTGETVHDVITFETSSSLYQVQTPSGIANVRGTNFVVTVDQASGRALFSVNEGSVWVSSAGINVLLESGQTTLTQPDMPPQEPAYSFQIKGILNAWGESTLKIGNITLNVSENMLMQGKPAIGDMARAVGHIDETGVWWTDLLASSGGKFEASFSGILESKGETIWQVSGTALLIDANTKLTGFMEIGEVVKVDYRVQNDGQYLAIHIRPHGEGSDIGEDETYQAPKLSSTTSPTPTLTITPTPTMTSAVTPTTTFTVIPTVAIPSTPVPDDDTSCGGGELNPTGMMLAERYSVPYDEIMYWFCQGFGFGEIDLAYSLSQEYDVPVSEIFAMISSNLGWGEIKEQLEDEEPTPTERVKKPTPTIKVKDK